MSRRTRTLLPTTTQLLKPKVTDDCKQLEAAKRRQAYYYDKKVKDKQQLQTNDTVRTQPLRGTDEWEQGIVSKVLPNRSYEVTTTQGQRTDETEYIYSHPLNNFEKISESASEDTIDQEAINYQRTTTAQESRSNSANNFSNEETDTMQQRRQLLEVDELALSQST